MRFLYKILNAEEWAIAAAAGVFRGSAADHEDGFIHLSDASQVRETAARHFRGRDGLVLVAFREDDLQNLRWESSRGGALFPHVYGTIPSAAAAWVKPLPLADGRHAFPAEAGA